MSVWKVLLIWLMALAGTGCLGFLMAGILALNRGADELAVRMQPPAPPRKTPASNPWWIWLAQVAIFTLALSAERFPPPVQRIYQIVTYSLLCSLAAFFVIRALIFGWRAERDGRVCIMAAAACALLTAGSGYALWRFN